MATEWHYSKGDEKLGPVTAKELKRLVETGKIQANDQLWKEGMAEWVSASTIKGLFSEKSDSETDPQAEKESSSAQQAWKVAQRVAKQVGRTAAQTVQHESHDEFSQFGGGSDQPAVFLQENYFGGRSRIGIPPSSMSSAPFLIAASLFSWPFAIVYLLISCSAWQFLPFSKTEFLRINLQQSVLWSKVTKVFLIWIICMFVTGGIMTVMMMLELNQIAIVVCAAAVLLSNFGAATLLAGLGEGLYRSQISLEYGFPKKYRLLCGYSDAPIEKQIDGVLRLCEAIAESEFSQWDQISTHGNSGMLNAIYSRLRHPFQT